MRRVTPKSLFNERIAALLIVSTAVNIVMAGTPEMEEKLAVVVEQHQNAAPDEAHELGLVTQLSQLSDENPASWLPDFWAAYFLTQITMAHETDRTLRLRAAQTHLDRARQRMTSVAEAPMADLHGLQSLIYTFELSNLAADDDDGREVTQSKLDGELARAYELNPRSPVVMVFAGTTLIRQGNSEQNWAKLMGGLALLNQAQRQFDMETRPRGLTSHFNEEWIRPWAGWAQRTYREGFQSD